MRAGTLRHSINVERNTPSRNSIGEDVPSWSVVYSDVRASLEPLTGRELFSAQQFNAQVTHKVTIRHEGRTITPIDRIVLNDSGSRLSPPILRIFEITSVINLMEKNIAYEILCFERIGRAS